MEIPDPHSHIPSSWEATSRLGALGQLAMGKDKQLLLSLQAVPRRGRRLMSFPSSEERMHMSLPPLLPSQEHQCLYGHLLAPIAATHQRTQGPTGDKGSTWHVARTAPVESDPETSLKLALVSVRPWKSLGLQHFFRTFLQEEPPQGRQPPRSSRKPHWWSAFMQGQALCLRVGPFPVVGCTAAAEAASGHMLTQAVTGCNFSAEAVLGFGAQRRG